MLYGQCGLLCDRNEGVRRQVSSRANLPCLLNGRPAPDPDKGGASQVAFLQHSLLVVSRDPSRDRGFVPNLKGMNSSASIYLRIPCVWLAKETSSQGLIPHRSHPRPASEGVTSSRREPRPLWTPRLPFWNPRNGPSITMPVQRLPAANAVQPAHLRTPHSLLPALAFR